MSDPQKLHPIAALLTFLKELKNLVFPVVFLVLMGKGQKNGFWDYLPLAGAGVMVLFVLIAGVVKWLRFTYRLEEGELKIEYGLFIKKKRYIPIERIQSLHISEGLLHRAFGLVKVSVETAGGAESESEAELTAIKKAEAQVLQQFIKQEKKRKSESAVNSHADEAEEADHEDSIFYRSRLSELLLMAATSGGIGVVLSAVFAFLSQFQDVIPYEKIFKEASHFIEMGVAVIAFIVFLALLIAWGVSIGLTLLRYAGFTLRKGKENLMIQKGLLEKQQLTIPVDRVQGITISENPLRQILGYCSVHLESAGSRGEEEDSASMMIMPMVKKERALNMLAELFPDYCFSAELTPLPARAASRYIGRACLYVLLPIGAAVWFFWPFGLGFLAAFMLAALYGFVRFKGAGWHIDGRQLTIRARKVSLQTSFVLKNRIQSLEVIQTWRQKQKDLASVHAAIRSGIGGKRIKVANVSFNDAGEIYRWYELKKEEDYDPGDRDGYCRD